MTNGHNGKDGAENKPADQMMLNRGLAQMLKGGVIMDVVTPEQAKIAAGSGRRGRHGAGARPGGHSRPGRRGAHDATPRSSCRSKQQSAFR